MTAGYVADTHALAYYLADKLPRKAGEVFEDAEKGLQRIYFASISIAEIIHIFEKTKTADMIWEMFESFDQVPNMVIYPLDVQVLRRVPDIALSELHDRIIVATSLTLKAEAVLTKDEEIRRSGLVKTTW